jgi:hypothetical protein
VPTDWGPVVQTAIGAVAAILGGFVGAWWQARGQQRIERDRAAETAAAAIEQLQDLDSYQAVEIERSNYKTELEAPTRRRLDVRGQRWQTVPRNLPNRAIMSRSTAVHAVIASAIVAAQVGCVVQRLCSCRAE